MLACVRDAIIPDNKNTSERRHFLVGERGLEPPRVAPLAPKASVSTISPLALTPVILAHDGLFC